MNDTIFALATGSLPSAIAIVRVSGPAAGDSFALFGIAPPLPRRATRAWLLEATGPIDDAIVLWFPGSATATGEAVAEYHVHGSRAVVSAIFTALSTLPRCRHAMPGEFTRRSFENGRLDLSQVEALGALLNAETALQRRAAVKGVVGGVRDVVTHWESALHTLAARVETQLDFSDDVADDHDITASAARVAAELRAVVAAPPAERLYDGVRVVLSGAPNAGKSSLVNALVGRDAAIVTAVAGTTRDIIEVPVVLDDVPLILVDTAGVRVTHDVVEAIGVERAEAAIATADIILALDDAHRHDPRSIVVLAKADVVPGLGLRCSAETGEGLSELRAIIVERARALLPSVTMQALNVRQRAALIDAAAALERASVQFDLVLVAEELRCARTALGTITGRGDVEALLDTVFATFCLGK